MCACPLDHAGRLCNIGELFGPLGAGGQRGCSPGPGSLHTMLPTVPTQRCFKGDGTEYRGVSSTAASGLSCLAWNSDLLYQELHVDSVGAAALLGLGPHAYCRSALAWPTPGHRIQGGRVGSVVGEPSRPGLPLGAPDPLAWVAAPANGSLRPGSGPRGLRPLCPFVE